MSNNTVTLLLVEDDDVAAEAVERAFRKAKIANPIVRARDGVEALAMLHDKSVPPTVSRPHLILLDLKMPRMNGLTFLQELRNDPELKQTIVFVLTTSDSEKDRYDAYKHLIAGYIVKSRAGQDFMELIQLLDHYWRVVEFPP